MRVSIRASLLLALLVTLLLGLPVDVTAQRRQATTWDEGHVSLMAGVSLYDRSGTGTMAIYAARADMPIYPSLLLEGGLGYARRGQSSGIKDVFLPDVQVQLQGTGGRFNPYVGLGGGVAVETIDGSGAREVRFSPSFSAGLRIALAQGAGLRFEGRLHGVDADFQGLYSALTGGLIISW